MGFCRVRDTKRKKFVEIIYSERILFTPIDDIIVVKRRFSYGFVHRSRSE